MKFEPTMTFYRIVITSPELTTIQRYDDEMIDTGIPLWKRLDHISGVEETDYDDFFGPSIFLGITTEYNNEATHNLIKETIENYIKEAKKFLVGEDD